MFRPIPVPGLLSIAWKNGSKIRWRSSSRIPTPLSLTTIRKCSPSGSIPQLSRTSSFVYLLAFVNRLLTTFVTASLSMIAVKCSSGQSTVNRLPPCSKVGAKRSLTPSISSWMFCGAKCITRLCCSTLRKSSSWFTSSNSRWALRSITRMSSLPEMAVSPFMIFSSGPIISDTGVRISWAIIVKKFRRASRTSFSFSAFSRSISC